MEQGRGERSARIQPLTLHSPQSTFCMGWTRARLGLTWACHTRAYAGWAEGGQAQLQPKYLGLPTFLLGRAQWGTNRACPGGNVGKQRAWAVLGPAQAVPTQFCVGRTWANPRRYSALCFIRRPAAGVCPTPAHASDLGMPMQSPIGARMGNVDWDGTW